MRCGKVKVLLFGQLEDAVGCHGCIDGGLLVKADAGAGYSAGYLRDGEQGIDAVQGAAGYRDADDGQGAAHDDDAGKGCGEACNGEDDGFFIAGFEVFEVFDEFRKVAVSRVDDFFMFNVVRGEVFACGFHEGKVALAAVDGDHFHAACILPQRGSIIKAK